MKIAFVADAHLIADADPHKDQHATRRFFKDAWPSFASLMDRLNGESPDAVVFLGDLVDWFSPENVDFALDLVGRLKRPWLWTPGNHDLEGPDGKTGANEEAARAYWTRRGCHGRPQEIDAGATRALVFDSALSAVSPVTEAWVETTLARGGPATIATHVPIDIEPVREWIRNVAPSRNLKKYVQSGSPDFYEKCLRGRIQHALAGHLHLEGELTHEQTAIRFLSMSISCHDLNRDARYVASAAIMVTNGKKMAWRKLALDGSP